MTSNVVNSISYITLPPEEVTLFQIKGYCTDADPNIEDDKYTYHA